MLNPRQGEPKSVRPILTQNAHHVSWLDAADGVPKASIRFIQHLVHGFYEVSRELMHPTRLVFELTNDAVCCSHNAPSPVCTLVMQPGGGMSSGV